MIGHFLWMKFCLVLGVLEVYALQTWVRDEIWWYSSWRIRGVGRLDSFGESRDLFLRLAGLIGLYSLLILVLELDS